MSGERISDRMPAPIPLLKPVTIKRSVPIAARIIPRIKRNFMIRMVINSANERSKILPRKP
jgi:hypothetical protein